jgi:hypothetical protein
MEETRGDRRRGQLKRWFEQFGSFSGTAAPLTFRPRQPMSEIEIDVALGRPFFEMPVGRAGRA